MFKLEFGTHTTAFAKDPDIEVANILRELADVINSGHKTGYAQDRDGEYVGDFELTED